LGCVPMDLNRFGWNTERLIYLDHATVVPIDLKIQLKDNGVPPRHPSREHSDMVLKVDLKVRML